MDFIKRVRVESRHASGDVEHDSPLEQQNCDCGIPEVAFHKKASGAERRREHQNGSEDHPSHIADREVAQKLSVAQFGAEFVQRPRRRLRIDTHFFHPEAVGKGVFFVVLHNALPRCLKINSGFRNDAVRARGKFRCAEQRSARLKKNLFAECAGKHQKKQKNESHVRLPGKFSLQ
ncbi:MAG TPA: hypothetical protein DDZ11_06545 [Lentisphaeria bacterium]|nr:hypothetical protein [Lentisphaeria bacterium]